MDVDGMHIVVALAIDMILISQVPKSEVKGSKLTSKILYLYLKLRL